MFAATRDCQGFFSVKGYRMRRLGSVGHTDSVTAIQVDTAVWKPSQMDVLEQLLQHTINFMRTGILSSYQDIHQDAHVPHPRGYLQWPAPVPDSSSLLMRALGGSGNSSSGWVLAILPGPLRWVPRFQLHLQLLSNWGVNLHENGLALPLGLSNKF